MGLEGRVNKAKKTDFVEAGNALGALGGAVDPALASLFSASVSKQSLSYEGYEANRL